MMIHVIATLKISKSYQSILAMFGIVDRSDLKYGSSTDLLE